MSKSSKQIACSEAVAVARSLPDAMFSDTEIELIVRLAWTARRSNTTSKSDVYDKIISLIDDVGARHQANQSGLAR